MALARTAPATILGAETAPAITLGAENAHWLWPVSVVRDEVLPF